MIDTILLEAGPGELRAAMLGEGRVWQVEHHRSAYPSRIGAIYLGRVHYIDKGINAAFVALGDGPDGLLRARDAAKLGEAREGSPRIERLVHEGEGVLVQVTADPHGTKGPVLTRGVRLSGRYLHYRVGRSMCLDTAGSPVPDGHPLGALVEPGEGAQLKDAGRDASTEQLAAELTELREAWREVRRRAASLEPPARVDPGPAPIERVMAGHAHGALRRVVAGDIACAETAQRWARRFLPGIVDRIETHGGPVPLFEELGVDAEIEAALAPRVPLEGGGELVFEVGETLTAIDVNAGGPGVRPGRAALDVNLSAAPEIARQLRLRGIGGAIVLDALKLDRAVDRARLVDALRAAFAGDPAECHVLGVSRLGLVEMTRRRLGPALNELLLAEAPASRPNPEAVAYRALRVVPRAARATPAGHYTLAVAAEVAALLEGPLAPALADAARLVGGGLTIQGRAGWPRERFEIVVG
ncbi:MAG: ribonuclease E/G [Alphaproteobacteria bacterium]